MSVVSAFWWTFLSLGSKYGMKLLGNLALARLLAPHDFGLSAIVFSVVSGIEAITDVGSKAALIRSNRSDPEWLDTAWTLGVIRGVAVGVVIVVAAWPMALFFRNEDLFPMIAATASMSILAGLTSSRVFIAMRDLDAKTMGIVEAVCALISYVVMIGWAWLAPSAWALLAGAVLSTGAFTAASFVFFGRAPVRFCWNAAAARELMGFGKWVLLSSLVGLVILQGDRFVLGRLMGITEVGIYSIAVTWAQALQQLFGMFLSRLYMPVVAKLRHLQGEIHAAASRLQRSILIVMLVPFAWTAGAADPIIQFLYPSGYDAAGTVMGILVVGAWFSVLEFLYNDQLMVNGEPQWRVQAQVVSLVAMAIMLVAMAGHYTLNGVALIFTAGTLIRAAVLMWAHDRHVPSGLLWSGGLTLIFLLMAGAVAHAGQQMLANGVSALVSLSATFAVMAPLGALLCWRGLQSIFRQSPSPTSMAEIAAEVAEAPVA